MQLTHHALLEHGEHHTGLWFLSPCPLKSLPRPTTTRQAEFRLLSGDLVNVTLEEVDESEPGSRRRMLSQLREELATGRRLLNTDTAPLPGRSFRLKSLRPVRQTEQKEVGGRAQIWRGGIESLLHAV